jgi:hypothetical protein
MTDFSDKRGFIATKDQLDILKWSRRFVKDNGIGTAMTWKSIAEENDISTSRAEQAGLMALWKYIQRMQNYDYIYEGVI